MARCVAMIVLTALQEQQLTAWARVAKTPQRLARRARVVLGSAAGLGSRRLVRQEQMSRTTVQRLGARFMAAGCDGLQDRPRRGRPSTSARCVRPHVRWLSRWHANRQTNEMYRSAAIASANSLPRLPSSWAPAMGPHAAPSGGC
jgi:hypothetical protein